MFQVNSSQHLFNFRLESKQDQQKYANIICDFSYFKIGPAFEKKIEDNEVFNCARIIPFQMLLTTIFLLLFSGVARS